MTVKPTLRDHCNYKSFSDAYKIATIGNAIENVYDCL